MKMLMAAIALVFTLMIGNTATVEAAAPGAAVPALQIVDKSAVEAVQYGHHHRRHYGHRRAYRAPRLYYGYSYGPRYYAPRKHYRKHYRTHRHYRHYRRW